MKTFYIASLALTLAVTGCNPAREVPATRTADIDRAAAATPTAKGTLALAKLQQPSGAFENASGSDHLGITAICALALLSSTDVAPSSTSPHLLHAADFILNTQSEDGYFQIEKPSSNMYDHAFATLFLTQLYATISDENLKSRIAPAVEKAIHLIEKAQSNEGGWRYLPSPKDADVSVSAAQLKALSAAKLVGFKVPQPTLDRAIAYLKSNQLPDGGFSYTLHGGASGWARSAAATAALLYAGIATTTPDASKALRYLKKSDLAKTPNAEGHYYYGNYYLAQTLNLNPEDTTTAPALRDALLQKQDQKTSLWSGEAGTPYATAMALIVLYMPDNRLPAFHAPAAP